jgi:hypothetical protein
MSLSFSVVNNDYAKHPLGNKRFFTIRDVAGDSAHPNGGYAISPQSVGLNSRIDGARLIGLNAALPAGVGDVVWDQANQKFQAVAGQIPPLVPKEVVTVTSHAGRLAYVPGYIIAAAAIAGGTTGPLRIIPVGETPATGQVAVNLVTGAMVFATADAVTSAVFTYIPLGIGPFIEANRVVDEARTAAANTFNFANRAALIQYVWNDTGNNLPAIQPVGEAPGSTQIAIDIQNSGNTTVTTNASQGTDNFKVTYWKFSALGLDDFAWTDQADITITSTSLFAFADDLAVPPNGIWIPGFGNVIVGEATTTNKQAVLVPAGVTGGANIAVYFPTLGKITLTAGDGYTTIELPYIFLNPGVVRPIDGQVPAGFNLSSLNVRMMFIGQ